MMILVTRGYRNLGRCQVCSVDTVSADELTPTLWLHNVNIGDLLKHKHSYVNNVFNLRRSDSDDR